MNPLTNANILAQPYTHQAWLRTINVQKIIQPSVFSCWNQIKSCPSRKFETVVNIMKRTNKTNGNSFLFQQVENRTNPPDELKNVFQHFTPKLWIRKAFSYKWNIVLNPYKGKYKGKFWSWIYIGTSKMLKTLEDRIN